MKKTAMSAVLLVVAVAAAAGAWRWRAGRDDAASRELVLFGNVDLRQVSLAFHDSERISEVLAQEGDRVRPGQVLARLDTSRLTPRFEQARAQADVQRQIVARLRNGSRPQEIARAQADVDARRQAVERLRNGSRPEEIAQARAAVDAAKATAENARRTFERDDALHRAGQAVSLQEVDDAKAALDVADARFVAAERALDLAVAGPRKEDVAEAQAQLASSEKTLELVVAGPRAEEIAEAEAALRAAESQAALLRQELADAELVAPLDAVVRTRLSEPGEMSAPQTPVFSLAVTDPKWVRAYAAEPDLARVRPGAKASVAVDGFPDRRFEGRVGFVSSVAEFTPKTVQTEDLRTSLVYEVRVFVIDPADELRLGMPATVRLPDVRTPVEGAR